MNRTPKAESKTIALNHLKKANTRFGRIAREIHDFFFETGVTACALNIMSRVLCLSFLVRALQFSFVNLIVFLVHVHSMQIYGL